MDSRPARVSVVTPVYNGGAFLGEAIESVLRQTFSDWNYVILDNCSTDETPEIAAAYAAKDCRIRVLRNNRLLPIIANWNAAVRLVDEASTYCKVLHADDWLDPHCLERMVGVAERHPTAGLVGARVSLGQMLSCTGLEPDRELFSGAEIGRATLLDQIYVFGSPSALLIRADLIRERPDGFYDETFFHADFEVCYRLLRRCDFGFVHEPLTYSRRHAASQTSTVSARYNTSMVEEIAMMRRHGPCFLDEPTYRRLDRHLFRRYRRLFARRLLAGRGREYWAYHRDRQRRLGIDFGPADLLLGAAEDIAGAFAGGLRRPIAIPGAGRSVSGAD